MKNAIYLFVLSALILSGCGQVDPKIYNQNGPVADGDILVEAESADAQHLNPPLVDEVGGADIDALIFEGLTRYNANLQLEPCLATKWVVSRDGKTITYYLRRGVKFQDGVDFTAKDVLFTYKVYTDPGTNTPYESNYQDIRDVTILGPYMVQVRYKRPFAPALSSTFDAILPEHLLEGKDINTTGFDRHPIGTGPFKFVKWESDQEIVLAANPTYWGGKPHLSEFIMRVIPDQTTQFLELLDGGIDAIGAWLHGSLTPEEYTQDLNTPKFKDYYNAYQSQEMAYTYIGWNLKNPLFQDRKVRQALTMALDRNAIIENVLYGEGTIATGPFALHSWANNPQVKPWPYDPKKAEKYLKEAGWKMGKDGFLHKWIHHQYRSFQFTLLTNEGNVDRERVATIVQQQLKEVGIDVKIQIVEWTTFLSQYLEPRKFDAVILGWTLTPDPDCYEIFDSRETGEHQFNFVGYKNPTVDYLLSLGRGVMEEKKRQPLYWKVDAILHRDQPYTFLYVPDQLSAIHKRFKGYFMNANGILTHPEAWYVPLDQQKYKP